MLAQLAGYYSQGAEDAEVDAPLLLDQPELSAVTVNAAYSLRKLRDAYSGSAIRVRRSSDNAEQDIGFDGNALDTASLLAFCGAGDGFVTTAYAQSGSLNLTQATAGNQPRIVNAGVVESANGHPSIRHLLAPSHAWLSMDGASWAARPTNGHEFIVLRQDSSRSFMVLSGTSLGTVYSGVANPDDTSTNLASNAGTPSYYVNGAFVAQDGVGTRATMWTALTVDALLIARTTAFDFISSAWRNYRTEFSSAGTIYPIEHQFERIIVDGDTIDAAGSAAIEQNQAAHYGIAL